MASIGILDPNAAYGLGLSVLAERSGFDSPRHWVAAEVAFRELLAEPADILIVSEKVVTELCGLLGACLRKELAFVITTDGRDPLRLTALQSLPFDAFLLRSASAERIAECLHTVADGHAWLDPDLFHRLCSPGHPDFHRLSKRELEIARLASDGLSNKHIARSLKLSDGTVKIHLHHVFAKLHVSKRSQLRGLLMG